MQRRAVRIAEDRLLALRLRIHPAAFGEVEVEEPLPRRGPQPLPHGVETAELRHKRVVVPGDLGVGRHLHVAPPVGRAVIQPRLRPPGHERLLQERDVLDEADVPVLARAGLLLRRAFLAGDIAALPLARFHVPEDRMPGAQIDLVPVAVRAPLLRRHAEPLAALRERFTPPEAVLVDDHVLLEAGDVGHVPVGVREIRDGILLALLGHLEAVLVELELERLAVRTRIQADPSVGVDVVEPQVVHVVSVRHHKAVDAAAAEERPTQVGCVGLARSPRPPAGHAPFGVCFGRAEAQPLVVAERLDLRDVRPGLRGQPGQRVRLRFDLRGRQPGARKREQ